MRNRDPHRENVENILAICLPIMTMQHIRESPSASHAMRKSAWNAMQEEWVSVSTIICPLSNLIQLHIQTMIVSTLLHVLYNKDVGTLWYHYRDFVHLMTPEFYRLSALGVKGT